jgi:hypothetical protein
LSDACSTYMSSTADGQAVATTMQKCEETRCKCIGGEYKNAGLDSSCSRITACSDEECAGTAVSCKFWALMDGLQAAKDCKQDYTALLAQDPETRITLCVARSCRALPGCKDSEYKTMCPSSALAQTGALAMLAIAFVLAVVM